MMPGPLLEDLLGRVAGCFPRRETRQCCGQMVSGLLMELEDHNCWTIAEAAGHRGPHWMQHLLSRAVWDEQQVLDIASAWALGVPGVRIPAGRLVGLRQSPPLTVVSISCIRHCCESSSAGTRILPCLQPPKSCAMVNHCGRCPWHEDGWPMWLAARFQRIRR